MGEKIDSGSNSTMSQGDYFSFFQRDRYPEVERGASRENRKSMCACVWLYMCAGRAQRACIFVCKAGGLFHPNAACKTQQDGNTRVVHEIKSSTHPQEASPPPPLSPIRSHCSVSNHLYVTECVCLFFQIHVATCLLYLSLNLYLCLYDPIFLCTYVPVHLSMHPCIQKSIYVYSFMNIYDRTQRQV